MRSAMLLIASIMMLFSGSSESRGADDAKEILAKAIKAHGGEEVLAKAVAQQWKSKGVIDIMAMKMDFTCDYMFQAPNHFRFLMKAEVGGQKIEVTAGTNGKVCWEQSGDNLQEMETKKAKAFLHNVYVMNLSMLAGLKDKTYTLTPVDEIKVEGKPAVGFKVSAKDHPDVMLYFDKTTHLLAKSETKIWDEFTDKDVVQETIFAEYKEKNGVNNFSKLIIKREGKVFITEEMMEVKTFEKLDAKLFEKPTK